jgi:hypothetical protein
MPADSFPLLLPYSDASTFQRIQALHGARRILDAAYPFLTSAQWEHALAHLQLPLQRSVDQASLPPEALATLVQYLEAQYRTPPLSSVVAPPTVAASGPASEKPRKQTYAIEPSLIVQLARVSHWCRRPGSRLVNEALAQLLRRYPEAQVPVPES